MHGILIFGDSITFGRGDQKKGGWSGRLKEYFEKQAYHNTIYPLGIGGNTSEDILNRIDAEANVRIKKKKKRYILIISVGINDSKLTKEGKPLAIDEKQFRKNILQLITKAKKYTKDIIFTGIAPIDEKAVQKVFDFVLTNKRVTQYNNIIRDVCEGKEIPFLDMHKKLLTTNYKKHLPDGLHPNSKGYDIMYKLIKEFLIKNKIIK